MKFSFLPSGLIIIFLLGISGYSFSQTTVKGKVRDGSTGEGLISASVVVKGTTDGMVTDFEGNFEFSTNQPLPFTLEISYIGYSTQTIEVTDANQNIRINLQEDAITTEVVEVKGRRISEKQQQSPLTMETMDNIAIKETPAANFYDGLGSLKDVDLTAASLGFKIINTRGFNSTSPVRSLQIIDGVDNQSPGLNFSLGNFLGASELDVNRVNLIVGASSAFYGPNAFNGVISMETKNPFLHQGLSAMIKVGERNLVETGFRWAQVNEKKSFGYKINFSYFRADDWEAENFDDVFDTPSDETNPGGWDAVNIYGDEYNLSFDLRSSNSNLGVGIIHREGYQEADLVDYNSNNLKVGAAFHFRLKPELDLESPEFIVASNYSQGTTVYQGDNRFSLRNIQFYQHRLELQKRDKYFIRAYVTHEDAGDSYDPYFTALLLQENAKEDSDWLADYLNFWQGSVISQLRGLEGFPNISDYIGRPVEYRAALDLFLTRPDVNQKLNEFHSGARMNVRNGNLITGTLDFFEVGTPRFEEEFNNITTSTSFLEGGTKFFDRSALAHVHGEYQFNDIAAGGSITDLDLLVGGNSRVYMPNSMGTILLDTFGRDITTWEYGVYGGGTMELNNVLKISASLRMDKNQNFDYLFSPAASLVYTPTPSQTLRFSFSSAIRNPTLADQYLFYNVGRAILIGNLNGFNDLITINSLRTFTNTINQDDLEFFDVDPIEPEKVRTLELGYRTTLGQLYLDATYYYSYYTDFIGFNLGAEATFNPINNQLLTVQAFRVAANATDRVTTQGFSIGLNYYFGNYYVINGNYSWNKLNTVTDDPIIPAFNTPEHKFNIGLSARDMVLNIGSLSLRNLGFNINYKWIDEFLFEGSPQFTGVVPQYDLLDAQINWRAPKINTTFKLGASNILDNQAFQTYGGPTIGRLAYFSVTYDFVKR